MDNIPPAPEIEGATHLHSGKVRDVYDAGEGRLLMVMSDRISAFDVVLPEDGLPSDELLAGEDAVVDAPLRIALEQAGFRRQGTHVFAVAEDHQPWPLGDSTTIEYDPVWGFPRSITYTCGEDTADCGSGWSVRDFEVIG